MPIQLNQLLLDNLTTAVILLDEAFNMLYLNTAAEIILSKSAQQCHGLAISDAVIEKTDSITLQQALEKNQPCTKYDACFIINNHETMVDYTVTPLTEQGSCYFIIEMVSLDVLKVARDEVIASQQQGNKLLIKGLAHEIKNPLGGIRGVAQLLARELPNETFQEYTTILIEEADRLSHLVDRMLGSNKLPHYQSTNIHEVLDRVYHLAIAESQGHIRFIKDYDPSIPEINMDAEQMIQAVLNIVRNAMQALFNHQTAAPNITFITRVLRQTNIATQRYKMVIKITIIDNGPGILAELKDTLFYPMVSGRPDGTGLGLAITQNIINQHKGIIECSSQPNCTQFSILLPLA